MLQFRQASCRRRHRVPLPVAVRRRISSTPAGCPRAGAKQPRVSTRHPDPGQSRMGAAGLNDLNAPPAPDAQPGDLEQAVEYLSSMPEAEMSGLNLTDHDADRTQGTQDRAPTSATADHGRRLHAARATLKCRPFDEMLDAEIARREAGQGGQPQLSSTVTDQLRPDHDDDGGDGRGRAAPVSAKMVAMHAPQGPSQAGLSPMMPRTCPRARRCAPQAPAFGRPRCATDTGSPVGTPMSMGQYATDTMRNLPGSLKGVGEDLWGAVTDPIGTAQGDGRNRSRRGAARQGLHGRSEHQPEMLGDLPGDRPAPLGEHLQRYGPDQDRSDTLRRDPAGRDHARCRRAGRWCRGGAAGARAATMGAKFGRHIADIDAPPPRTRTTGSDRPSVHRRRPFSGSPTRPRGDAL